MKVNVESFLYFEHNASDYVLFQKHSCYEIVFYKYGSGRTIIGEEDFKFSSDNFVIISPNTLHDEHSYENAGVYFCLFTIDDVINFPCNRVLNLKSNIAKNIYDTLEEMRNELKSSDVYSNEYINILFTKILILIIKQFGKTKLSENEIAEYAKKYIKENYNRPINFQILSESLGYSYDRLRHIFSSKYDSGMHEYLLRRRISVAKLLLIETKLTSDKISQRCGFASVTRFNEAFKKLVGISAQQFRKSATTGGVVVNIKKKEEN